MGYHENDWCSKIDQKQDLKIKAEKITPGDWVNLDTEYGDVWHEVKDVHNTPDYYGWAVIYSPVSSKSAEVKTEMIYFHKIRRVLKELPKDTRCMFSKDGAFSPRRKNLNNLLLN